MPCWTYQTAETDPGKMMAGPLIEALKEMGLFPKHDRPGIIDFNGGSFDIKAGTLSFQGRMAVQPEKWTEQIKMNYANEAVKYAAKKMGWQVNKTANNEYEFTKR